MLPPTVYQTWFPEIYSVLNERKCARIIACPGTSSDPTTIPWLLLATRSTGKDGSLAKITFIQHLETVGGKAPSDGCTQAKLNQELRVDYTV